MSDRSVETACASR